MKACQSIIEKNSLGKEWGFCLDTAHAFVQGQPLTTEEDVKLLLDDAKGVNIRALHLNGSLHPFRSGRDQHASIATPFDYIWGNDRSGLPVLLDWIGENKIPSILERPGTGTVEGYQGEIDRLRKIVNKKKSGAMTGGKWEEIDYSFPASLPLSDDLICTIYSII
jgi:endonuclease IV